MTSLNNPLIDLSDRLNPSHCAVVVIDMQNDFCAEDGYIERVIGKDAAACRDVVGPILKLTSAARDASVPVIWIRAEYPADKIPAPMRAKQLQKSTDVCASPGSWGADFYGLTPEHDDLEFVKNCFSAFVGTGLAEALEKKGIRTLVFVGVQTNVCVDHSVRDALCAGFYSVVVEDCVASHTPALHTASLANIAMLYGDVLPRATILDRWADQPTANKS